VEILERGGTASPQMAWVLPLNRARPTWTPSLTPRASEVEALTGCKLTWFSAEPFHNKAWLVLEPRKNPPDAYDLIAKSPGCIGRGIWRLAGGVRPARGVQVNGARRSVPPTQRVDVAVAPQGNSVTSLHRIGNRPAVCGRKPGGVVKINEAR
jgi:hypothetical protein